MLKSLGFVADGRERFRLVERSSDAQGETTGFEGGVQGTEICCRSGEAAKKGREAGLRVRRILFHTRVISRTAIGRSIDLELCIVIRRCALLISQMSETQAEPAFATMWIVFRMMVGYMAPGSIPRLESHLHLKHLLANELNAGFHPHSSTSPSTLHFKVEDLSNAMYTKFE